MQTIIWCLAAVVLTVSAVGFIAVKAVWKTVESLELELSGLEEILVESGTLSVKDALSLCEKEA